jgi:Na+/H+ antiporter NhaD/arsenite permease-like protein
MNLWIALPIIILTYAGIALGTWPKLRVNRTTLTLVGVGLLLATEQVSFDHLRSYLDFNTLTLLFSMMVIIACLELAGFFRLAAETVLERTHSPRLLLAAEVMIVGLLAALFLNDTICLMVTPLVLDLTQALDRNPIPYLIALPAAANVGSAATLTGNPQNIIIGVASHISYVDFMFSLAAPTVVGLLVVWVVIVALYPREFQRLHFEKPALREPRLYRPLLLKSLIVTAGLLIAFLAGVPVALAAFLAACALLLTRRIKPEKIMSRIDWSLLVFFAALFIISGVMEDSGITLRLMNGILRPLVDGSAVGLSAVTAILSNLVSNVPAVLLLKPVMAALPNPRAGWLTLAAASTLAGNLTLLGSVANLIVAEIASRRNVQLKFWEYTRAGVVITLLTLAIAVGWIQWRIWK